MLRNREFLLLCLVIGLVSVFAIAIATTLSIGAAWLVGCTIIVISMAFCFFTKWRYKEIEKLSEYLRKITAGDYSLDVRDNREGELSILKNDIYKVTLMLSEQSARLEQDKTRLTDAISDISHQLKTPLTSMTVMSDLLNDPNLPQEKRREFVQTIRLQLERIEWLVSALLKLSKIDAGTVSFKKSPIVMEKLIQAALEPVLIPMDIKEQQIVVRGDKKVTFEGDFHWTREALINMIKNCVEHTPEKGTITISYASNPLYVEIIISDNGKGIPKADVPYIFQRFYKGKNAGEDSVGIGLAMAYSIIANQNGDIEVKSEEGQGTQFLVKFYR